MSSASTSTRASSSATATLTGEASTALRSRIETATAAIEAARQRLREAQERSGAIFLDGTATEKQAHRTLLRDLERECEEQDAILPVLETRLAAALAQEETRQLDALGARFRVLAAETRKQLTAYDAAAAQLFRILVKLEGLYGEGRAIERRFKEANRAQDLPETDLFPGTARRAGQLFTDPTFNLFPRALPSDTHGEFHSLRAYRDERA